MKIERYKYLNVEERAKELGVNVPTGIALLPRNFESALSKDELIHESDAPTVRILFRKEGIEETPLEVEGEKYPYLSEKSFEWAGPIIFVSWALYSQNPRIVDVALGVFANYLTDFFRGVQDGGIARFDIVRETSKGRYERYHYEGPPSGISEFAKVVHEVKSDD